MPSRALNLVATARRIPKKATGNHRWIPIRELTAALNYGLNKVRFPATVRVGSRIRAAVTVMSAQQTTSGVESMCTISDEIDGEPRPACAVGVIVVNP